MRLLCNYKNRSRVKNRKHDNSLTRSATVPHWNCVWEFACCLSVGWHSYWKWTRNAWDCLSPSMSLSTMWWTDNLCGLVSYLMRNICRESQQTITKVQMWGKINKWIIFPFNHFWENVCVCVCMRECTSLQIVLLNSFYSNMSPHSCTAIMINRYYNRILKLVCSFRRNMFVFFATGEQTPSGIKLKFFDPLWKYQITDILL